MTSLSERIELIEPPETLHVIFSKRGDGSVYMRRWSAFVEFEGATRYVDARKAEALKQEVAEKDARIAALEEALEPFAMIAGGNYSNQPDGLRIVAGANPYDLRFSFPLSILRRARTLINGGSDADR